jgi:polycystin 2
MTTINKKQCISIISYITFLGVFTGWAILAYGNQDLYYLADRAESVTVDRIFTTNDGQQLTFKGITSADVMYYWISNVFINSLVTTNMTYLTSYNRLLGGIRFRQIRITPDDKCTIDEFYQPIISNCYAEYSPAIEYKSSFGPDGLYKWQSADELNEIIYNGKNVWYKGNGYVIDAPLNKTILLNTINDMQQNSFIDEQTRILFIDFNTYNAALNIHLIGRITFEFLETGGIRPVADFSPIILFRYRSGGKNNGTLTLTLELATFFIFLVYMGIECRLMYLSCKNDNCYYFKNPWNLIEIFNFIMLIIVFVLRVYSITWISSNLLGASYNYVPLQRMVFTNDIERYATGVNGLLLWIKLFRYLTFMKRFQFIFDLLSYAVADLFFFLVMFFIFIIGMAQMGFLFFYQDVPGFRSFLISIITLIKGITSGLDSDALESSNRFFGPLFFLSFNIVVILILINIFLAIINEAYEEISRRRRDNENNESKDIQSFLELCECHNEHE